MYVCMLCYVCYVCYVCIHTETFHGLPIIVTSKSSLSQNQKNFPANSANSSANSSANFPANLSPNTHSSLDNSHNNNVIRTLKYPSDTPLISPPPGNQSGSGYLHNLNNLNNSNVPANSKIRQLYENDEMAGKNIFNNKDDDNDEMYMNRIFILECERVYLLPRRLWYNNP